jgi:hypothetical protein
MNIRCKVCGEFFSPDDETLELMSDGYLNSGDVNTCDDCWDLLNHLYDDPSDMISDADPGL